MKKDSQLRRKNLHQIGLWGISLISDDGVGGADCGQHIPE